MNKRSGILFAAIILIVAIILAAYLKNDKPSSAAHLKIGLISGTTGDYAVVGENWDKGVELAKDEWLAAHPDQQITMIAENDEFDGKKGLSAYQKLSSVDGVDAFVSATTATIDAAYGLIHQSGKPFIQGFEQSQPAEKDNIFQVWPSGIPTETLLGQYVKQKGYKDVAIVISQNITTWTNFANAFKKGYAASTTDVIVDANNKDVRTDVLKLLSFKPDAVVLYTVPKQAALIVKEVQKQSKNPPIFVWDQDIQTGEKDIKEVLGGSSALNGSIAMVTAGDKDAQAFVDAYKKKYGEEPGIGASTGYDAFNTLMKAYDPDVNTWLKNIQNSDFMGASGEVKFNDVGLRVARVNIGEIKDGQLPLGIFGR